MSNVVHLHADRPGDLVVEARSGNLVCVGEDDLRRARHLAEIAMHDPQVPLPESSEFRSAVEIAGSQLKQSLEPGCPQAVREFLSLFAQRRGIDLPLEPGLSLDIDIMASWPGDLFIKAARGVWENFQGANFPQVPDFKSFIVQDLVQRRDEMCALDTLSRKLDMKRRMRR